MVALSDSYTPRHTSTYADSHTDCDFGYKTHCDTNGDSRDAAGNANRYPNSDRDANFNRNFHRDGGADCHRHIDPNCHLNADRHCHSDCCCYSDRDCYCNGDCHSDINTNGYRHCDALSLIHI